MYLEQGAAGRNASPQLGMSAADEQAQAGVHLSTWQEIVHLLASEPIT